MRPGRDWPRLQHARPKAHERRSSVSQLDEVKNWNCCGAMEVKNIDPKIQTYLSSRVLSNAVNQNKLDVVMAPCNGCYHNLKKAEYDLAHDAESREVVDRLSQKAKHKTYEAGQAETIHALDWLKEAIGEEELATRSRRILAMACGSGRSSVSCRSDAIRTRGSSSSHIPVRARSPCGTRTAGSRSLRKPRWCSSWFPPGRSPWGRRKTTRINRTTTPMRSKRKGQCIASSSKRSSCRSTR